MRQILADQIAAGRLRPGQRLGAERALATALGVSRATPPAGHRYAAALGLALAR